jgi:DNA-binding SARP family transcriptional activator
MKLLNIRVLGPPSVRVEEQELRFRTRKAQALLLYLAVTGGLHTRDHLMTLLWPEADQERGRADLRNALAFVRQALDGVKQGISGSLLDCDREVVGLLTREEAAQALSVGLDLHDLADAVKQVSHLLNGHKPEDPPGTLPDGNRATLRELQQATSWYRGPFLANFSLPDAPDFMHWVEGQRAYWQRQFATLATALIKLLLDQGEAPATLEVATHWQQHDPMNEAAYRYLMEVHAATGNYVAALQAYDICCTVFKTELGVAPGAETVALGEHIRSVASMVPWQKRSGGSLMQTSSRLEQLPLVGRGSEFATLVAANETARMRQMKVVIVEGELGSGKTRLVDDFLTWARFQGADVLTGRAFDAGGRLPYQPIVEALRLRLACEHAPDDLLDDVWLTELSRLLPDLRERYPDLSAPGSDDQCTPLRLFGAVAELGLALSARAPGNTLIFFLDNVHWADVGTRDLLRFLIQRWREAAAPILMVFSVRTEEVAAQPALREWLRQVLCEEGTHHLLLQALDAVSTSTLINSILQGDRPEATDETIARFAQWLHAETGGQPLYLVQTLAALLEKGALAWSDAADGKAQDCRLRLRVPLDELANFHGLVPAPLRLLVQSRLERLSLSARHLLAAGAVLGKRFSLTQATAVAGLAAEVGLEAVEEALRHLLVREESGGLVFAFIHEKFRDIIYTEAHEARRRFLHARAIDVLKQDGASSAEVAAHMRAVGLVEPTMHEGMAAASEPPVGVSAA